MKQVNSNPTVNGNITLTTYAFTKTDVDGVVTMANAEQLERGQSVFLDITNSDTGFEEDVEYFVIPVDDTSIALAATREDAFDGIVIETTGDAGPGTVYPTYRVGGVLYVGTGGDLSMRGIMGKEFSDHKNIPDGSLFPCMIGDIKSQGATASDLVAWSN